MLLEALDAVIAGVQTRGRYAFDRGDYDGAATYAERAKEFAELRRRVREFRKWVAQHDAYGSGRTVQRVDRTDSRPRGRRTPKEAFRRPILEALVELGGRASVSAVLDRVERKMRHVSTNRVDQPLT